MTYLGGFFKGVAAVAALVAGIGLFSLAAAPAASFTMTPAGNPVVGQTVQFSDTSSGGPTSWSWNFDDGQVSTQQSPTHVYAAPGPFNVTLTATNASGSTQQTQPLVVSTSDTLRLNSSHAFLVTLVATNQHNNNAQGPGQAIPQNDLFGYFSLPTLTGNPDNPEVFVKILDGTTINGQFWVFYGHLTDLIYDITVTEVATGFIKTYHKDAGNSAGGFDTSGFSATATPTITLTPTITPTPGPPTATPTPTPTGGALITVNLVARDFHWDFDNSGQPTKTLHVGQPYRLNISRAPGAASHQFTGLPEFSCSAATLTSTKVCNFTPSAGDLGDHFFGCDNSQCGTTSQHNGMQNGVITIVP